MAKTYLNSLSLSKTGSIAILASLSAAATLAPLMRIQLLTGTAVNASLILAVCLLPKKQAAAVALLPSLAAAATGLLPAALVPLIPLIVAANMAFVSVFGFFVKRGYAVAALAASLAKFALLSAAGAIVLNAIAAPGVVRALTPMISYWQLVTALFGCLVAFAVLKSIKLSKING